MNMKQLQGKQQLLRVQRLRNLATNTLPPISPQNTKLNNSKSIRTILFETKRRQQISNIIERQPKLLCLTCPPSFDNSFEISQPDLLFNNSNSSINDFDINDFNLCDFVQSLQ
ncbi:Hypothetical_protein [Hexamita inflata]|uniref:Hypothetical_protein n=1 Tax=Hexamita inflata TaxID=28002 RepID=A0AA86NVC7_9EUKA|nr:Hypothetical protein HINF_LOCUS13046 [Hexamita inflata]